ncbi:hypothetical protein CPT_Madawaska_250 [Staphylococcus phage Madawaska]|nr:hypothetical protein CPT_Madawaska_250 [Staphylococcus phage Madawaska]
MILAILFIVFFGLTLISFILTAVFWYDELYLIITTVLAIITVVLFVTVGIFSIIAEYY